MSIDPDLLWMGMSLVLKYLDMKEQNDAGWADLRAEYPDGIPDDVRKAKRKADLDEAFAEMESSGQSLDAAIKQKILEQTS